ncbi:hypothetical protein BH23CHL4_BH23CHL4_06700 [soil metagenome]
MHPEQSAQVAGVILAAGQGSRMGSFPKQLLELKGKWLLQHAIDHALRSLLDELVIVLGYEYAQVRELIWEGWHGQIVVNPHYTEGQSGSVQAGIRTVSASMNAAMMLLGDQPGVTTDIIDQLVDVYTRKRPLLVVPRYNSKRGNPVIIDRSLFAEIENLTGDTGAKSLLDAHASEIEYLDFPFPAPRDIDTHDDLEFVKRELGG